MSPVIGDSQRQMTLQLDAALTERFSSLLECLAAGVYRRGLKRTAADLDLAPGNLSVALAGDGARHFGVDHLERYVAVTGDKTPIYYLVAKYLGGEAAAGEQALATVLALLQELPAQLAAAGLQSTQGKRR